MTPAERTSLWRKKNPEKHREQVRRWRKRHPERAKEKDRRYKEANKEKVYEWARKASRKHYWKNRERLLARNKKWREKNQKYLKQWRIDNVERLAAASRKHEYGITQEEFLQKLKAQKGRCAICHKKPKRTLHVDHDHKTKKFRSLLCKQCNSLLGFAHESIEILSNAIKYLEAYNGR